MSALKDWMDTWPLPDGEPFIGETIRADGWVYRDLSRMTSDAWELLSSIIGPGNVKLATWKMWEDGSCRGQVWISPSGMENLKAYRTSKSA